MKATRGTRVRLRIKLEVDGGDVLEQNVVEYIQGSGTMLVGIEELVEGKEALADLWARKLAEEVV